MSSSFRSSEALRRAVALGLVAVVSSAVVPDAGAAQTYFVPTVEVRAEYNDNFGLTRSITLALVLYSLLVVDDGPHL